MPLTPVSATASVNTSSISNRRLKLILTVLLCDSAALAYSGIPAITPSAHSLRGRLLQHGRLGPNERDCHVLHIRKRADHVRSGLAACPSTAALLLWCLNGRIGQATKWLLPQ